MRSPGVDPSRTLKLFISYAHEDDALRMEFEQHLAQVQREHLFEVWSDRQIAGGSEWQGEIDERLERADIAVLLVSPAFLNSKHCQQEWDLAISNGIRVIPVILRPCDWNHGPLARFQAYPTDGNPVVNWPTRDAGFLNVVNGLRRVAKEMAGAAKVVPVGAIDIPISKLRLTIWMVLTTAMSVAAVWLCWSSYSSALTQGERLLDIGRFDSAEPHLRRAAKLNPFSRRAAADITALDVNASRSECLTFRQRTEEALATAPRNPFLRLLSGDARYYCDSDRSAAQEEYQMAVDLRQTLAEGFWRLGIVKGDNGDHNVAIQMFENARRLSPDSHQYQDGLAGEYFWIGDLEMAAHLYDAVAERGSASAAVEGASVRRLLGDLENAERDGKLALELLASTDLTPEYRLPWAMKMHTVKITLTGPAEKQCYAEAEYSATLWLRSKRAEARSFLASAQKRCGSRWADVKAMLEWQLAELTTRHSNWSAPARDYRDLLDRQN